ncbi:hypothetical protein RFI_30366 [Reticulomyxa filosa]|uniref:Uncharacterized protein n=1 Tax=Reticulomyxa filosa TaxID=46433 RepID=X6M215_RETFI|nr:hypothetical protein RFI_30366 [Reticulomyxa filosa]|eukprot:ETO07025.1 hypothetical protein RFI_30366 [Reticulomyxa filosa]
MAKFMELVENVDTLFFPTTIFPQKLLQERILCQIVLKRKKKVQKDIYLKKNKMQYDNRKRKRNFQELESSNENVFLIGFVFITLIINIGNRENSIPSKRAKVVVREGKTTEPKISKSKSSYDERSSDEEMSDDLSDERDSSANSPKANQNKDNALSFPMTDHSDIVDIDCDFPPCFVEQNNRVQEMLGWCAFLCSSFLFLIGRVSETLTNQSNNQMFWEHWASEFDKDDEFGMDLTNFMFHCAGIRTWQLTNPQLCLTPPVDISVKDKVREVLEKSLEHSPTTTMMLDKIRQELGILNATTTLNENSAAYLKWKQIFENGETDDILFVDKRKQQNRPKTSKDKAANKKQVMTRYKSFWHHIVNAIEDLLYENKEDCIACVLRFCELLSR